MAEVPDFSFDGRRYSGVVVSHQSLDSLEALMAKFHRIARAPGKPIFEDADMTAVQAEWHHAENLYPYGSTLRRSTEAEGTEGLFRHRCLLAEISTGDRRKPPVFVFASPHVRVVGGWCDVLGEALENPRLRFAAPRLDNLFHDLGKSLTQYRATQITLQLPSDVDVEKVALTGKSPLISSLRANLEPVTRPYAVRLEFQREGTRPLRVHLDRHGNYWWHQADNDAFAVAARAFASLDSDAYFEWTHDPPDRRIASEDRFA